MILENRKQYEYKQIITVIAKLCRKETKSWVKLNKGEDNLPEDRT